MNQSRFSAYSIRRDAVIPFRAAGRPMPHDLPPAPTACFIAPSEGKQP